MSPLRPIRPELERQSSFCDIEGVFKSLNVTLKELDWEFENEGTIYQFRTKDGMPVYCNVEGSGEIRAHNRGMHLVVLSE